MTTDATPDAVPVPLRQRSIPDQLDYFGDKLAAQIDTQTVPRDAVIAMGAAIVGIGHIATVLRKQDAPLTPADFTDLRAFCDTWLAELAQHGWLSRRLLLADGSELDVSRLNVALTELEQLRARVEQLERESFAAALDTGPGTWCWNRHPDHPLPCGRFAGHDGQHVRGEHRWDNEQQPEGGDRG